MQVEPQVLTAIGGTLLSIGGGAVATIKFLFSRFETQINERVDAMDSQITKLEGHVDECNKDRIRLNQQLLDVIRQGQNKPLPPPGPNQP